MPNKEFQVRHGLIVNNTVLVANVITNNVGIGRADPNYTLDVVGSVNASNILVNGTAILPVAVAAFGQANTANTTAVAAFGQANTALTTGQAAYNFANTRYSSNGGTITGDVSIIGNLTLSGNTLLTNVNTFIVNDPLIYLAGNNYTIGSDIVDIGFVANYPNATVNTLHTGLYRSANTKMYYLFQGYDIEPANNKIVPYANNMVNAVLNADIITSNLTLGGANAILSIATAFGQANTALTTGQAAFGQANTANTTAVAAFGQANTALTTGQAAFARANTALQNTTGTFAGTLTISNDLFVTGNVNLDTGTLFVDAVNNRVGIGTTTPTSNLQVIGNANVTTNLRVGGNVSFDNTDTVSLWEPAVNTLAVITSSAERVRFDPTGNVLIGRTNSTVGQSVKLDVVGAINASAVLVNGAPLTAAASITVTADVVNATRFLAFANGTSGTLSTANVSTGLTFNPSSNTLTINGPLNATTKSFVIEHPIKPNMKLRYGSLEGPENGVYVRGKIQGVSTIELPEYWWKLIDEDTITVNLTPYGYSQDVFVVAVSSQVITLNQPADCYYTVYAERKDVDKLIVEY